MNEDFPVIVYPYLWKWLKNNDDDDYDNYFVLTIVLLSISLICQYMYFFNV